MRNLNWNSAIQTMVLVRLGQELGSDSRLARALHELFDKIAEHAEGHVDALAERITALGGTARGTVRTVAARSSLKPYPENIYTGAQHLEALAIALATAAKASRQAIEIADDLDDEVTADLFNEITGALDKDLWFIEAHLQ